MSVSNILNEMHAKRELKEKSMHATAKKQRQQRQQTGKQEQQRQDEIK